MTFACFCLDERAKAQFPPLAADPIAGNNVDNMPARKFLLDYAVATRKAPREASRR